jgi:hypothetical protein
VWEGRIVETVFLMVLEMESVTFRGGRVVDAGAGTR